MSLDKFWLRGSRWGLCWRDLRLRGGGGDCSRLRGRRGSSSCGGPGSRPDPASGIRLLDGRRRRVHRNQTGEHVTDFAVAGCNAGKDEAVDQKREALAARDGGGDILLRLSRLAVDLDGIRMAGTVDVGHGIGPRR